MNRSTIIIALILISLFTGFTPAFAEAEQTAETTQSIAPLDLLEKDLLLLLPKETDNPNLTLIFADPSGEGVQLKIDGQEFSTITSPHILPSLAIGEHSLTFKYTDGEEVAQEVGRDLIIVPRAPVINPPSDIQDNTLVVDGTTLPLSTVKVFLTGAAKSYTAEIETDASGEWEYIFEEDFKSGIYTIVAIAKKNGYASTFADPIVFSIDKGDTATTVTEITNSDISFSFGNLNGGNLISTVKENPHLAFLVGGTALVTLLFSIIIGKLGSFFGERSSERSFRKQLKKSGKSDKEPTQSQSADKPTTTGSPTSLRGKFEAAGFKTDKYVPKTGETAASEVKSGEEAVETISAEMSKEEFLSKFKEFDPDEESKRAAKKSKKAEKKEKTVTKSKEEKPEEAVVEKVEAAKEVPKVEVKAEEMASEDKPLVKIEESKKEETPDDADKDGGKDGDNGTDVATPKEKGKGDKRSQLEKSIRITLTSDSLN